MYPPQMVFYNYPIAQLPGHDRFRRQDRKALAPRACEKALHHRPQKQGPHPSAYPATGMSTWRRKRYGWDHFYSARMKSRARRPAVRSSRPAHPRTSTNPTTASVRRLDGADVQPPLSPSQSRNCQQERWCQGRNKRRRAQPCLPVLQTSGPMQARGHNRNRGRGNAEQGAGLTAQRVAPESAGSPRLQDCFDGCRSGLFRR